MLIRPIQEHDPNLLAQSHATPGDPSAMDDDHIREMFEGLGPVTIRRLFGGKGIYHAGLIVAIDFGDEILLKADATSAPLFAETGARQWTYESQRRPPVLMPYWSIPDEALDDPETLAHWVRLAFEAALRSGAAKPKPPRQRKARSAP